MVKDYFQVSFNMKVILYPSKITQNAMTGLLDLLSVFVMYMYLFLSSIDSPSIITTAWKFSDHSQTAVVKVCFLDISLLQKSNLFGQMSWSQLIHLININNSRTPPVSKQVSFIYILVSESIYNHKLVKCKSEIIISKCVNSTLKSR